MRGHASAIRSGRPPKTVDELRCFFDLHCFFDLQEICKCDNEAPTTNSKAATRPDPSPGNRKTQPLARLTSQKPSLATVRKLPRSMSSPIRRRTHRKRASDVSLQEIWHRPREAISRRSSPKKMGEQPSTTPHLYTRRLEHPMTT